MAADGTIKISTSLDVSGVKAAMSKFADITKTGLKGVSVAVGAVSTALTGAGVYAVKTGIEFESAFAGVKKTVDATDAEMEGFRQGIRDMAKEMPQSASSIAEVAEAAGQLGIKNDSILSFTRVMSDLGVATNMSATEAATSLARLANITQMPQENFDRLGSTIVALGNNLATTESEITEMGLRLAGAGKQVGMTEAEILGLAGAISSVGIEADAGGSAVSTVMAKMQLAVEKGGDSLQQFADVAGMSAQDFQKAFRDDAAQALVSFVTGLGTMEDRGQSAIATLSDMEITEIRQRDALLRLSGAGDILSESLGIAAQAWDENNALTKEAEQRYETLESRLQILKNNVSDLGISFYDGLRDPLKSTVDEGIKYVEQLSDAFGEGGLKAVVGEAGEIFADIAVEASEQAPKMVDASVDFIQSFADGIYDNRKELVVAAGDIAETLAQGLSELLPKSVREPVQDAIKDIADSFENGGLNDAVETASTTIGNFGELVEDVAKVALPPLTKTVDFAGEHLDVLAASATGVFVAFKGYKVFTDANSALKKGISIWKTASAAVDAYNVVQMACTAQGIISNAQLTIGQAAVGLLTGRVSLATAAQTAWNVVLSANPIGLVVAAVGALAAGLVVYKIATDDSKESQYALTEEQKKANEEIHKQYEAYKELDSTRKESMEGINAEYGYLTELKNELNELIDSNGRVKAGYEDRANFIINELSQALGIEKEKIWETINANGELGASIDQVIEKKKAEALLNANEEAYTEAIKNKNSALQDYTSKLAEYETAQKNYNDTQEKAKKVNEEYQEILRNSPEAANGYLIANQDILEAADEAKSAYDKTKKALKEAEATYVGYSTTIQNYEGLSSAIISGDAGKIEEAMLRVQNSFITAETGTRTSLENQVKNMQTSYEAMKQAVANGTPGVTQQMVDTAKLMVDSAKIELDKLQGKAEESTKIAGEKARDGLASNKESIDLTAKEIADSSNEKLGSADTKGTGARKSSEYNEGVGSKKVDVDNTSKTIADSSNILLGSADTSGTGNRKGAEYNLGLGSNSGAISGTASYLSGITDSGLGSANTGATGSAKGAEYASGVGSQAGAANTSGQSLASNAESGAGTGDGYTPGSDFGSGFISGIGAWLGEAASAAANLAMSAYNALRNALEEHSPSRKSKKSGKNFDLGLGVGIDENADVPIEAAEKLTESTLEALDSDLVMEKLKSFDISDIMSQAYNAIDERHAIVSNRIVVEIEARENMNRERQKNDQLQYDNLVKTMEKMANQFGRVAGNAFSNNIDGMKIQAYERDLFRLIREVDKKR